MDLISEANAEEPNPQSAQQGGSPLRLHYPRGLVPSESAQLRSASKG